MRPQTYGSDSHFPVVILALGMRKLLGMRTEEKPAEISANCDGKAPVGVKGVEVSDKLS